MNKLIMNYNRCKYCNLALFKDYFYGNRYVCKGHKIYPYFQLYSTPNIVETIFYVDNYKISLKDNMPIYIYMYDKNKFHYITEITYSSITPESIKPFLDKFIKIKAFI